MTHDAIDTFCDEAREAAKVRRVRNAPEADVQCGTA
jgi:hypothetical protein